MEGSEKKNKFSLVKLISISVSLVAVIAVAVFFVLNGKDSLTGNNNGENTIALSRMALSVGNEIDVDLGELKELNVEEISYSSKDENVAKINEKGVITAVNDGETDIVVVYTVDDVTYEKNVNVVVSSRSSGDFSMSDDVILDYTFDDGVKENVWTDKNVRINVSSNAKVKYAIDCNENCNYVDLLENGAINVTTEGDHIVTIVAYDNNDNSVVKRVGVKIDKTKPICKFVKGPTPDTIYVGETATYVIECVDENSRLKVVNDIPFLDVELPKKFTFTKNSIVDVVKDTYKKTKKTAIKVENIDDGYRYTLSVTGLKAGKARIELPQNIFADYAGNLQDKVIGQEITVLEKGVSADYLYCNLSYEKGVITGRGVSSYGLAYYGFSSSYSGNNETTLNAPKTGTYYYYVKDVRGNTNKCKIEIAKKDLSPTCSLKYDEKESAVIGAYIDVSGSGMSYYGFSSTYSGTNTNKLYVKKSGTYYFYVKDANGNTAVCEETVKVPLENPSCKLSYDNGVLVGSSYDVNGFGISYEGFSSSYSGTSEYTQNVEKPGTYYYYVKDSNGMTGSCSITITESMLKKLGCNLTVDKKGDSLYIYGPTFDSDGSYYSYYGFSSSYSGAKQNSMKITRGATYTYYVMDKYGNKGSCSIDTTDKPSCSLSFADQGTNGCIYLKVNTKKGTKYGAEIVHGNFVGLQGNVSGNNIAKVCGQKKYTYLVMDAIGNTSTCSIDLTDKPTCTLTVEVPNYSASVTGQNGVVIKATYKNGSKNYPISGSGFVKYDATFEKVVTSPGTYQYYVKDIVGNEGSCSITIDAKYFSKPSCSLTYENGILTGRAIDGTGSGIAYYGFSKNYSGSSTSTLRVDKAGTYTFYVKDNYGYVASCSTKVTEEVIQTGGKLCSSGTYYDNGTCKTCPIGSWCDGVEKHLCPTGNTSAAGAGTKESCYTNIPVGHYKQDPESSFYPSVAECLEGQYSLGGKVYYGSTLRCTSCPKGTYSAKKGASSCTSCPSGYTTKNEGADSVNDCNVPTTCEDGKYLDGTKCKDCPKGSYCTSGVKNECPNGYTSQKNAGDITKCYIDVKAGYYISYPASNSAIKCSKGTYSSKQTVFYGQTSKCTPCDSGTTTKGEGSDSKNDCSIATSCPSGQYLDGTKCKDCPTGYKNSTNATSKSMCYMVVDAGKYVKKSENKNADICAIGSYSAGGKVYYGDTTKCTSCPTGYTTKGTGAKSSSDCSIRSSCSKGAYVANNTCVTCPRGYYCDGIATSKCPTGYTSEPGASAITSCYVNIDPGYDKPYGDSAFNLEKCSKGYYNKGGKVYYGSTLKCIPCPQNTYSDVTGASSCKTCANGTTTSGEGKSSCDVKTICKNGEVLKNGKCNSCPKGSYCISGVENSCPDGYTSDAGATAKNKCYIKVSGGNYLTTANTKTTAKCVKGTYKEGHTVFYGETSQCNACDANTTTKGIGADSKGDCNIPTTCPSGQYLDGDKCKNCPGGSYCINSKKYDCPVGYRNGSDGAKSVNECSMKVKGGSFIGVANSSYPTTCMKGTYKEEHSVTYGSTSSCVKCDGDYTTKGEGSDAKSDCSVATSCKAGKYLNDGKCKDCPNGYTSADGATSQNNCYMNVAAGKYIKKAKDSKATNCEKGKISTSKKVYYGQTSFCTSCPVGTTTSEAGRSECNVRVSCATGEYLDTSSATCKVCTPGYYCSNSKETRCPSGYTSNSGSTKQTDCYFEVDGGYFISNPTSTQATPCAKGYYKAAHEVSYGKSSSCTKCPDGTTTQYVGSYTSSQCSVMTSCKAGKYLDNGKCKDCPKGYTSADGATSQNNCYMNVAAGKYIKKANDSSATACPKGTYSASSQKVYYGKTTTCSSCTKGTYTDTTGAISCKTCPSGTTTDGDGKSSCDLMTSCKAGTYLDNGKCKNCPSGYTSDAGATSQNNCYMNVAAGKYIKKANDSKATNCEKGKISTSKKVNYGQTSFCTSCPAGTTTSGEGKSSCDIKVSCNAGEYLDTSSAKCKTCTPGYYCSNSKETKCPSGYTSNSGSTKQTDCYIYVSGGYFIPNPTSSQVTTCAKGYYKESHEVQYGKSSSCTKCPDGTTTQYVGSYTSSQCSVMTSCKAGKYLDNGKCKDCPKGYTSADGATSQNNCYMNVAAGKYIKKANDSSATACPKGTYSASSQRVYYGKTTSCSLCSQGTYTDTTGAISCKTCAAGTTTSGDGKSSCDVITACGSGKYLEDGKCKTCPSGYTSEPGSTKQSDCYMNVAAGKYIKKAKDSSAIACSKGTYSTGGKVNYGSTSSCASCPSGYTTSGEGSTSSSACSIRSSCSKGSYLDNGTCRTCPNGYYCEDGVNRKSCPVNHTSAAGASAITSCYANIPAGYYKSDKNSASNLPTCAKGTYSTSKNVYYGSTSSCTKCPAGKYTDTTGATSCKTCPSGTTTSGEGKSSCDVMTSCGAGKYLDNGKCIACPKGYTSSAGAINQNQCYITVVAGKYLKNAKDSSTTNCPKGTYTISNTTVYYGNTSSCKTCAAGTTTSGEGMTSCNVQVTCNAGEYVSGTSCKKCPVGSYCNGKISTKCPTGYDSNAGATKQSDCYIYVAAGQYLSYPTGSAKSSCPKGTYSVAHTVNYGSSDSCTKCPGGYTTSGTGSMYQSQCSVPTCVRDASCGCETYNQGYYKSGTYTYDSTCSNNKSNNTTIRNCKSYSTSSSGSSCHWVCDKYVYGNTTCKTYKCCEVNKGDDFEFNLINLDFISDMVDQILSKLF